MKKGKENLVRLQERWQRGFIRKEPSHNHKLVRACRACWCTAGYHTMSNWDVSVGEKDTVTLGMWLMWATHQWGSDGAADLSISMDRLDLSTPNCKTTRCSIGLLWQRKSMPFSTGRDHQKINVSRESCVLVLRTEYEIQLSRFSFCTRYWYMQCDIILSHFLTPKPSVCMKGSSLMVNIMQAAARGMYWEICIFCWSRSTNCFNMAWPSHSSKSYLTLQQASCSLTLKQHNRKIWILGSQRATKIPRHVWITCGDPSHSLISI